MMNEKKTSDISARALRKKLESNLRRWIPNNDKLVSEELGIFDRILLSRRDMLKLGLYSGVAALVGNACSAPSDWTATSTDYPIIGKNLAEGVANITASADALNGITTYRKFETIEGADMESTLEAYNPVRLIQGQMSSAGDSSFADFTKTYGHPEIVHITEKDGGVQELTINECAYNGSKGLKDVIVAENLPGFKSTSGEENLKYNQVVALNGSKHNTSEGSEVYNSKMIVVALNYNLRVTDPDTNIIDRSFDSWYKYTQALGNSAELHNQLLLYTQQGSGASPQPGEKIPDAPGDWQPVNLIDKFKDQLKDAKLSLEVPQKRVFQDPLVTVRDVDTYQDGMGNAFIYGTLNVDYFYNFGFIISDGEYYFFGIAELSGSQEENLCHMILKEIYTDAWGQVANLEEDSDDPDKYIPTTIMYADLFHQTFFPFTSLEESKLLFFFQTSDDSTMVIHTHYENPGDQMKCDVLVFSELNLDNTKLVVAKNQYEPTAVSVDAGDPDQPEVRRFSITRPNNIADIDMKVQFNSLGEVNLDAVRRNYVREYSVSKDGWSQNNKIDVIITYFGLEFGERWAEASNYLLRVKHNTSSGIYTLDQGYITSNECQLEDDDTYLGLWFDKLNQTHSSTLTELMKNHPKDYDTFVTRNHQGLIRIYINFNVEGFKYLVGFFEKGDRDALEQYPQTGDLEEKIKSSTLKFYTPMPVGYQVDRVLKWKNYLHDGEILYVADKQTSVSEKALLTFDNDTDEKSYFYATSDYLEGSWKLHELQGNVSKDDTEKTEQYTVQGTLHHIELQAINIYGFPVALPEGGSIEIRLADQVHLTDITDPVQPKGLPSNRTMSYRAKPDSGGKVVLQVDMGHEDDIPAGTSLYYRIIGDSALTADNEKPMLRFNGANDVTTTDWKVFNISYMLHGRLEPTDPKDLKPSMDHPQIDGGDKPKDKLLEKWTTDSKYANQQDDIITQISNGYTTLSDAAKPQNQQTLTLMVESNGGIDPLSHVMAISVSGGLPEGFWDWINPLNWLKQLAKLAKEAFDEIVTEIKKIIDEVLDGLANILDDLGAHGLANGCRKLEAVVDLVLNAAKMFVDILLDILIGLFDFKKAQEIGQKILDYMLKVTDSDSGTVKLIDAASEDVISSVSSALGTVEKTFDKYLEKVFGNPGKTGTLNKQKGLPWNNDQALSVTGTAHENGVHKNYVNNQLNNNVPSNSSALQQNNDVSDIPQDILNDIQKIGDKFTKDVTDLSTGITKSLEGFVSNGDFSALGKNIGQQARELLKNLISDIEEILQVAVDLMKEIGDSLSGACGIEFKKLGFLGEIMGILAALFKVKLDTTGDLAALVVGFAIYVGQDVGDAIVKELEKGSGFDISEALDKCATLDELFTDGKANRTSNDVDTDLMVSGMVINAMANAVIGIFTVIKTMDAPKSSKGQIWTTFLIVSNWAVVVACLLQMGAMRIQKGPEAATSPPFLQMYFTMLISVVDNLRVLIDTKEVKTLVVVFEEVLTVMLLGLCIWGIVEGQNKKPKDSVEVATGVSIISPVVTFIGFPISDLLEGDARVAGALVTSIASLITTISTGALAIETVT